MSLFNPQETQEFQTANDFLRYGLSLANQSDLYYGHGTDNAWDEMKSLVLGILHLPFHLEPALLDGRLTPKEKQDLRQALSKRLNERVPVPYLIKEAWFCGLPFYVDERVLIPRSPIAELIEAQFQPWVNPDEIGSILDLCTGSACIAIACCYAFPEAAVDAVDISAEALAVAQINQARHGLEEQLHLIQSDCFKQVPAKRYDLIVSNPPYVGAEEMKTLPREYEHEPSLALETGNEGLAITEEILAKAVDYLSEEGILVVEVGNSEQALTEAYPDLPLTWLEFSRGGQGVFMISRRDLQAYWQRRIDGRK